MKIPKPPVSFNVSQPVRAELEVSDIPSVFYTMDTVEIPVKALNLGRDKIYNAKVKLEADGLARISGKCRCGNCI